MKSLNVLWFVYLEVGFSLNQHLQLPHKSAGRSRFFVKSALAIASQECRY